MPNIESGDDATFADKKEFVTKHLSEVLPTLSEPDSEVLKKVGDIDMIEDDSFFDRSIEGFENKLFVQEKIEYSPEAKSILITVNDAGAYRAIKGLITNLEKDDRCKSIAVVTGGISNRFFPKDFGENFKEVRDEGKPFLVDILNYSKEHPFDIVIGSVSYVNGPESLSLVGKENLGASRTFLVFEGWASHMGSGVESAKKEKAGRDFVVGLNGIFCNPGGLARKIIKTHLPNFPDEKIFEFGTPNLDDLDITHSEQLRQTGRQKLGLDEEDFAVLFWGDYSNYPEYGADPFVNEKTFEKTLISLIELAKSKPDLKLAFLFRPHPGGGNDKYNFEEIVKRFSLPDNLKVRLASKSVIGLNEVAYATDVSTGIVSTEHVLATLRGRQAVYLGFDEEGGAKVFNGFFPPNIQDALKNTPGISIVSSGQAFSNEIYRLKTHPEEKTTSVATDGNSSEAILDKIFG